MLEDGLVAKLIASSRNQATPTYSYTVIQSYPHDSSAFTQGLLIDESDGQLYESTGLVGSSSLRKVNLETGAVTQQVNQASPYFSEGLALVGNQLFQLTWENGVVFVYDKNTLALINQFNYSGEGWGLTYDGQYLIMSNGTSTIQFRDPSTFNVVRQITVNTNEAINELEYIDGEIYANLWKTDLIARINPTTGAINSMINLSGIHTFSGTPDNDDVLNGIAYNKTNKKLYVTGKRWDKLYQIEINETTISTGNRNVTGGSSVIPNSGTSTNSNSGSGGCLMRSFPRDN